ncbi:MAG: hypothetical protein J6C94_02890 [Alistipes sp.]|nr:hypothetical protein [Alistipes sp.]
MWRKIGRLVGVILGWGVVLAYILFASHLADEHRAEQQIDEVIISMADSTEMHRFASSEQIRRQLKKGGFRIEKLAVDSVDAVKISDYISRNGFVRDVDVYATYSGKVYIDVKQHEPVARLLCGGLNSYITAEGEVFRSPQGAAYYAAVVTGAYRPLFGAKYEGAISQHFTSLVERENNKLSKLGEEFDILKQKRSRCASRRSELRKDRKQGLFESDDDYKYRYEGLMKDIGRCDDTLKMYASQRKRLEQRQIAIEARKKKLQKKYDDFANLLTFVTRVSEDSFWGAEVVQIVADTTSTGEISLRLVPRSGNFIVEFGTLENEKQKLDKLHNFYNEGLSHIGWEEYRVIDVRYDKQVICTK